MAEEESIIVGVDGSQASMRALRWALGEARRRAVPVHALMAWESHAVLAGPGPLLMQPSLAPHQIHERHRQNLIHAVRTCMGGASTPEVHLELEEGHVADVLVNRATNASMLVLGDHGQGRAAEVLLGSTALRCIHKARCPVVIIPVGIQSGTEAGKEPSEHGQ